MNGISALRSSRKLTKRSAVLALLFACSSLYAAGSSSPPWQDSSASGGPVTPWGTQAVGGPISATVTGVRVYVVDAGVDVSQADLNVTAVNPTGSNLPSRGCGYGHATHVAGIIGARGIGVVGILPGIPIISVSVNSIPGTDAEGACVNAHTVFNPQIAENEISQLDLAAAFAWVKADIAAHSNGRPGVVNLSISGGKGFRPNFDPNNPSLGDRLIDLATPQMLSNGSFYPGAFIAQSAGNQGSDACFRAFSRTQANDGIMVVGGLDRFGQPAVPATFGFINEPNAGNEIGTNYGGCVEIWAPSRDVYSTWNVNPQDTQHYRYLSGTSMAAPHVTAIAAYLLNSDPNITTPGALEAAVRTRAVTLSGAVAPDNAQVAMATLSGGGGAVQAMASVAIGVFTPITTAQGIEYQPVDSSKPQFANDNALVRYGYYPVSSGGCQLNAGLVGSPAPQQISLDYPGTNSWTLACQNSGQNSSVATVSATIYAVPHVTGWTVNGASVGREVFLESDQSFTVGYVATDAASCDVDVYDHNTAGFPLVSLTNEYIARDYRVLTPDSPLIRYPGAYDLHVVCYSPISRQKTGEANTTIWIYPNTSIQSGPGAGNSTDAQFTFTSNLPGAQFFCSLDGSPLSDCVSPAQYSGLSQGSHAFSVAASLPGLTKMDPTAAQWTWIIGNSTATSLTFATSPNPATTGAAVNLVATISSSTATGTVNFMDGSSSIGSCAAQPVSNGTATCVISILAAGTHSLSARYSGDSTFAGATSNAVSEVIQANGSNTATVTLAASPNPTNVGTSVTVTASVSTGATGTVTFRDGTLNVPWCVGLALNNGSASCVLAGMSAGSHALTAQYSGDATFGGATSAALNEVIRRPIVPLELLLN